MANISANYLDEALHKLRIDIRKDIKTEISELRSIIDNQKIEINTLKSIVTDQQSSILFLQRKDIEKNIVISGIAEIDEKKDKGTILEVLQAVNPQIKDESITHYHRFGKKTPRQLKVSLSSKEIKFSAVRNAKKLRDDQNFENVFINSDQTRADSSESWRLRTKVKELKKDNPLKEIYIKGGSLLMDGTEIDKADPLKQLFRV